MVDILALNGTKLRELELPKVFETQYRPDLIRRAVLSEQSKRKQPQGRFPLAGRRVAAKSHGPGKGTAKIPRATGKARHSGKGVLIHSAVGGRLLFPPSTKKKIVEKINKKEHHIALKSAIASTAKKEYVSQRGHQFDEEITVPLVVEDKITEVEKTQKLLEIFTTLGVGKDIKRCKKRSIRAGKGKMRGRKYKTKSGPLLILNEDSNVIRAGNNIPGVSIKKISDITVEDIAPGGEAARLTIWTEKAFQGTHDL